MRFCVGKDGKKLRCVDEAQEFPVLVQAFDAQKKKYRVDCNNAKFKQKGDPNEGRGGIPGFGPHAMEAVMQGTLSTTYKFMVQLVDGTSTKLARGAERCPCQHT